MLSKISRFIERHLQTAGGVSDTINDHQKRLATAALLVEVAQADHLFSQAENQKLHHILIEKFSLQDVEVNELMEMAKTESDHSTSIYQFTQIINTHCTAEDKFRLIKAMWEIAYTDGSLDKYEDHTIRKVADLIYVPHSDFIRAKSLVKAGIKE